MKREKIILILSLLGGIIPFITILFFHRTLSLIILLPLYFICLVTVITFSIWYAVIAKDKVLRIIIGLFPILSVAMFIIFYGFLLDLGDEIFVKIREEKLNDFVSEIKRYDKIYQMSDGERHWKTINDISIEPTLSKVDSTSKIGKKYYLNDVLNEHQISSEVYDKFREKLIDTDLIRFSYDENENEIVYFTIDGFQGSCVGIAHCTTNIKPESNYTGGISKWMKVSKNWFVWYTN